MQWSTSSSPIGPENTSFSGCHWVILVDLEAQEVKPILNSQFRTAKKKHYCLKFSAYENRLLLSFFVDDPVGPVVIDS